MDLTGEYSDSFFIATKGDTRISITLSMDRETSRLDRENRFIVDVAGTSESLAYRLSKPFKFTHNYGDTGTYTFVLTECNREEDDNIELRIANYYRYFPRVDGADIPAPPDPERKVWI